MADLNSLVVFSRVVEARSFSEAARRLKMPISTVSRRVAELENDLGVRLLDRSTRSLRLTEVGAEILEHAIHAAEFSDAVQVIASNQQTTISGTLRMSAPPSISDTFLSPLLATFQETYPDVRVRVFITDRYVDPIEEGVDLVLRLGSTKDSSLIARKLLRYRHQLVASPAYLEKHGAPLAPEDLASHRLLAFSHWQPETSWSLAHVDGGEPKTVEVKPHLAMNDYVGLAEALVMGAGIGDLPPIVRPGLLRDSLLMEVMPDWRFAAVDLALVHLSGRHVPRTVRTFIDYALRATPRLFVNLPS